MDYVSFDLKKINTSKVYQYFLSDDEVTKQDLVSGLGLTLPTITKNIDYLLGRGLIAACGLRGQTGGRSAVTYSLVADAKIALGLDISRHHIACVAVDLKGRMIAFSRQWLPFACNEKYFVKVKDVLDAFIRDKDIEEGKILGVGIGLPALVRDDNQSIFYSRIIDTLEDGVYSMFKKHIPYDVRLYNDAKAAAYAERWENTYLKNAFYILLSNNVGGALIINGKVYSGNAFKSAEVGHMTLVPGGKKCYCGQKGCVDRYLAATNLSADDLEGFFEKLQKGDKETEKIWDSYMDDMAATLRNVHVLLDCDVIVGGYVGAFMEPYITDLRKRVMKLNTFETTADYVRLCTYKNESIAAGSALHFVSDFIYSV